MTSIRYCDLLDAALLPSIAAMFPDGHRFQQDNDPKHASNYTKDFLQDKGVRWWKTPAESPDLNPIENVWAALKGFFVTK